MNVVPPSVLTCHCTVGVGLPLAAAVKVAVWPAVTVWLAGWVVTGGGLGRVHRQGGRTGGGRADAVGEDRLVLSRRSGRWWWLKVKVVLVAPAMSLKVEPPSVLTCHCTVGVGLPLAAAVKVAVWPAVTVWLAGWVVTAGALGRVHRQRRGAGGGRAAAVGEDRLVLVAVLARRWRC